MKTLRRRCLWVFVGGFLVSGGGCCYDWSCGHSSYSVHTGTWNMQCGGEEALIVLGVLGIAYGIQAIVEACRGH